MLLSIGLVAQLVWLHSVGGGQELGKHSLVGAVAGAGAAQQVCCAHVPRRLSPAGACSTGLAVRAGAAALPAPRCWHFHLVPPSCPPPLHQCVAWPSVHPSPFLPHSTNVLSTPSHQCAAWSSSCKATWAPL